ncbi:MAG: glycosyltransferase [Calothrix sp. C42_A2020_038]|nr:glycosyltransferase [Calothrix sp. C42_A2020_038]
MHKLTQTVIITAKTSLHVCGVGDYSINLSTYLKKHCGLELDLIVEKSCKSSSEPVTIIPYVDNWSKTGCRKLLNLLEAENVKTVILQYTPRLYTSKEYNLNLIKFWQECSKKFQTLLIAHETYYWFLKYPGTWVNGLFQQYILYKLVQSSHHIFCGSELYLKQIKRFSNSSEKIHYLPIPNNISPQLLSVEEKHALRQKIDIAPKQIVLLLFGCLASIRQDWVASLDNYLHNSDYAVTWLLLGEAKSVTVPFKNPVLRPGYLTSNELSHYLQISDLLLMPHEFGVSAKRTSLMSALEHGLPVVGTYGRLTDSFLYKLPSLFLAPDKDYSVFQEQVLNTISRRANLHNAIQETQHYYHSHLSWLAVTQTLLPYLQG